MVEIIVEEVTKADPQRLRCGLTHKAYWSDRPDKVAYGTKPEDARVWLTAVYPRAARPAVVDSKPPAKIESIPEDGVIKLRVSDPDRDAMELAVTTINQTVEQAPGRWLLRWHPPVKWGRDWVALGELQERACP